MCASGGGTPYGYKEPNCCEKCMSENCSGCVCLWKMIKILIIFVTFLLSMLSTATQAVNEYQFWHNKPTFMGFALCSMTKELNEAFVLNSIFILNILALVVFQSSMADLAQMALTALCNSCCAKASIGLTRFIGFAWIITVLPVVLTRLVMDIILFPLGLPYLYFLLLCVICCVIGAYVKEEKKSGMVFPTEDQMQEALGFVSKKTLSFMLGCLAILNYGTAAGIWYLFGAQSYVDGLKLGAAYRPSLYSYFSANELNFYHTVNRYFTWF